MHTSTFYASINYAVTFPIFLELQAVRVSVGDTVNGELELEAIINISTLSASQLHSSLFCLFTFASRAANL